MMSMLLRRYHPDAADSDTKPVKAEQTEEVKEPNEEVKQAATEKKKAGRPKKEA